MLSNMQMFLWDKKTNTVSAGIDSRNEDGRGLVVVFVKVKP